MTKKIRSTSYTGTFPVRGGQLSNMDARLLASFRISINHIPAVRRNGCTVTRRVNLKYRGPRNGDRYLTPKHLAYAVDVYVHDRRVWDKR